MKDVKDLTNVEKWELVSVPIKAKYIRPYMWGIIFEGSTGPFVNEIVHRSISKDEEYILFGLETHNSYKAYLEEEVRVVPMHTLKLPDWRYASLLRKQDEYLETLRKQSRKNFSFKDSLSSKHLDVLNFFKVDLDLAEKVNDLFLTHDPQGLIKAGHPYDEYISIVVSFCPDLKIKDIDLYQINQKIFCLFCENFDDDCAGTPEKYRDLSLDILKLVQAS